MAISMAYQERKLRRKKTPHFVRLSQSAQHSSASERLWNLSSYSGVSLMRHSLHCVKNPKSRVICSLLKENILLKCQKVRLMHQKNLFLDQKCVTLLMIWTFPRCQSFGKSFKNLNHGAETGQSWLTLLKFAKQTAFGLQLAFSAYNVTQSAECVKICFAPTQTFWGTPL